MYALYIDNTFVEASQRLAGLSLGQKPTLGFAYPSAGEYSEVAN